MREYTSNQLQEISSDFRAIARRLSRTDYSQCDANLKRFMSYIDSNEFVKAFIDANNIHAYDVVTIIKERYWLDPFNISPVFEEELSFSIQLLRYAVDNFDGDFTRLYGTHHYTSSKSTANDEMRKFIEHVIDPLIDYICEYIRKCYEKALEKEGKNNPFTGTSINATNSMVLVGSSVAGNATNEVVITETVKNDAQDLLFAIKEAMRELDIPTRSEIEELIEQIESEIQSSKKPKKGVLTALKVLCSGVTTIIPLVKALVELF